MKFSAFTLPKNNKTGNILAVHLVQSHNRRFNAYMVHLRKSGGKIIVKGLDHSEGSLEAICEKLTGTKACIVSIEGAGVLTKVMPCNSGKGNDFFKQLIPHGSETDFFASHVEGEGLDLLSLVRTDFVEETLTAFHNQGIFTLQLLPTAATLQYLAPLMDEQQEVQCGNSLLWFNKGKISGYTKNEQSSTNEYEVAGYLVSGNHLPALANGIAWLGLLHRQDEQPDLVISNRTDYGYKQRSTKTAVTGLSVFFVALLLNYLLFSSINESNNQKAVEYESGLRMVNTMMELSSELNEKESLIKKTGMDKRVQHSWIYDQIAASVPSSITLKVVAINPVERKERMERAPEFSENSLLLEGDIQNAAALYQWIDKLNRFDWMISVELKEIKQEGFNTAGNFVIEASYKL